MEHRNLIIAGFTGIGFAVGLALYGLTRLISHTECEAHHNGSG
jgi:hypothetical protein